MARGGRRPGAGRKKGSHSAPQQAAIDIASQVLSSVDQVRIWKKLLASDELKIVFEVMKYLTDRVHGRPPQRHDTPSGGGLAEILARCYELSKGRE